VSELIELQIERAVAGGRMLARHGGRVVFVSGTMPGERVRARVTRARRDAMWAETVEVLESSADRRDPAADPACGGLAFAHIRYATQLALKGQIIADAFRRLGRLELEPPEVAASPETAYRLRARLHVRDGQAGFFREGTHELCDAAPGGQLAPEALAAVRAVIDALGRHAGDCDAVVVAENVEATERVIHLEPKAGGGPIAASPALVGLGSVTGITTARGERLVTIAGKDRVADSAQALLGDSAPGSKARWARRPTSFFQGNRFLTGRLIQRVLALVPGGSVADLYAGVGLFTIALADRGVQVGAVEGDRSSSEDLVANSAPYGDLVRIHRAAVEDFLQRPPRLAPDAAIVDPPRTGMSADALDRLAGWGPARLVYVSCDPPTLARDAARLAQRGFRLMSIEGLDLFPNTPHVETIAAFARP
jgi:23S rRNA (uracil1939-C5)-methyltransferase